MSVSVCVTFVVFTDCESCTRPISTNPGSMEEECEYGLPSGTCFTARRLEVVAVAGLPYIYFVVCFFSVWWDFVFFRFLYFERTQPTASTRQPCLMYLSTSNEAVFCLYAKNLFIPGCVQGAIIN